MIPLKAAVDVGCSVLLCREVVTLPTKFSVLVRCSGLWHLSFWGSGRSGGGGFAKSCSLEARGVGWCVGNPHLSTSCPIPKQLAPFLFWIWYPLDPLFAVCKKIINIINIWRKMRFVHRWVSRFCWVFNFCNVGWGTLGNSTFCFYWILGITSWLLFLTILTVSTKWCRKLDMRFLEKFMQ